MTSIKLISGLIFTFNFGLVNFGLVACASSSPSGAPVSAAKEDTNQDTANGTNGEDSRILSAKKCPKNTKLVNGKCTISVESAD